MYTQRQKEVAIKTYFKNQKNAAQTVRELGYPTVPALLNWIKASHLEPTSRSKKETHRYTEDEKQKAVDLYIKQQDTYHFSIVPVRHRQILGQLIFMKTGNFIMKQNILC